jgi:hypothetical protein
MRRQEVIIFMRARSDASGRFRDLAPALALADCIALKNNLNFLSKLLAGLFERFSDEAYFYGRPGEFSRIVQRENKLRLSRRGSVPPHAPEACRENCCAG